ncbi:flagellar biosynthesis protein [Metabacillus crassostreae]|uniref:EscU/YscU/HrcU family type III secretion system export apparatus switch protein n=1 Tax=Metabacillus crassostreae TaxID=929098 RepID=UPI00195B0742|nr:EscU/YscU/HrcU family type III secretion system export apparatus switch protein [Metabacillus crassostreae]MBM7603338.1 flagellar biosynthesis protein [Metabacillus crassostreae]
MSKENESRKAVALKYNAEKEQAPIVIAKGKGLVADEIVETAQKHQVHIQEDPALIELLSKLEIHQQIPDELYEAVAEIFAFVYQLENDIKKK